MIKLLNLLVLAFILSSFVFSDKKPQEVIKRDHKGRVVKTYDGRVYRVYDSLRRRIEAWGNLGHIDAHYNFHDIIIHTDTTIYKKEYDLDDKNKKCIIKDTADYFGYFYEFNKKGELTCYIFTCPLKDKKGKIIGRRILEKSKSVNFDVKRFYSLPKWIK